MLEYTIGTSPSKRITVMPEYIETLSESGYNARQTVITTVGGHNFTVDAPYETVRIHVGQALGCDLEDKEFKDDDSFIRSTDEIA